MTLSRERLTKIRTNVSRHAGRDLTKYTASMATVRDLLAEIDRLQPLERAAVALASGEITIADMLRAVAIAEAAIASDQSSVPDRVKRARLALLLRVLLRADRGDYGPLRVDHDSTALGACVRLCTTVTYARMRPLWQDAPAWCADVTPKMRREMGR
jgi:hypothetical protein